MKKLVCIIIASVVLLLCGCESAPKPDDGKLDIVTTIFPVYDFARAVSGDRANVSMLLKAGQETHAYEPTLGDINEIADSDLFVYIGGESDTWVRNMAQAIGSVNELTLIDKVTAFEEEVTPEMDAEEDGGEIDEHIWTSPKNAVIMINAICEEMCALDGENADYYRENAHSYIEKINALDNELHEIADSGARKTLVFGDRFPFRYLTEELGLTYYAAFPGCSEQSEPGLRTVTSLRERVIEENIPVVFYIEFSNQKVADSVCEGTGAKKLLLHSCHEVSQQDFDAGITYLDIMTQNAQNIREALLK